MSVKARGLAAKGSNRPTMEALRYSRGGLPSLMVAWIGYGLE